VVFSAFFGLWGVFWEFFWFLMVFCEVVVFCVFGFFRRFAVFGVGIIPFLASFCCREGFGGVYGRVLWVFAAFLENFGNFVGFGAFSLTLVGFCGILGVI